eukprot:TRINITY_DN5405_c0_g1_i1.p1 TRINITY_DN5405_c0_g1~~TRINITY_DN5405_c0_g1_i1.p1  ORF type:complete len:2405 (+),score=475.09 TRINITY_DN5405_c0_g1_i1:72-7286(+)
MQRTVKDDSSSLRADLPIILQGFLKKRKSKSRHWKERWFTLDAESLSYYERRYDPHPSKMVSFASISGIRSLTNPAAFGITHQQQAKCIAIDNHGVLTLLLAETDADARLWRSSLDLAWSEYIATHQPTGGPPSSPSTPKSDGASMQGYLSKRSKSSWGWNERYFVLDGLHFKYFKDNKMDDLLGMMVLDAGVLLRENPHTFQGVDPESLERCFALQFSSKSTCFMAESSSLKQDWVRSISAALQQIRLQADELDISLFHAQAIPESSSKDSTPVRRRISSSELIMNRQRKSVISLLGEKSLQNRRHSTNVFQKTTPFQTRSRTSSTKSQQSNCDEILFDARLKLRKAIPGSPWKEKRVIVTPDELHYCSVQASRDSRRAIPVEDVREIRYVEAEDVSKFPDITPEQRQACCIVKLSNTFHLVMGEIAEDVEKFLQITQSLVSANQYQMRSQYGQDADTFSEFSVTTEGFAQAVPDSPPQIPKSDLSLGSLHTLDEESEFDDSGAQGNQDALPELDILEDFEDQSQFNLPDVNEADPKPSSPGKRFITLVEGNLQKLASGRRWITRTFSLRVFYDPEGRPVKRLLYFDGHQFKGSIDIDQSVTITELGELTKAGEKKHYCFSLDFGSKSTILEAHSEIDRTLWLQNLRTQCSAEMLAEAGLIPDSTGDAAQTRVGTSRTDSQGSGSKSLNRPKFMSSLSKVVGGSFSSSKGRLQLDGIQAIHGSVTANVTYKKIASGNSKEWNSAFVSLQGNNLLFYKSQSDPEPYKIVYLRKMLFVGAAGEGDELTTEQTRNSLIFEGDNRHFALCFESTIVRDRWLTNIKGCSKPSKRSSIFVSTPTSLTSFESLLQNDSIEIMDTGMNEMKIETTHQTDLKTLVGFIPAIVVKRFSSNPVPLEEAEIEYTQAAVLFADISGFTPLSEKLCKRGAEGAEKLCMYLNQYFETLTSLIRFFGGDTIKFAGDAVLAMWANGPLWLNTLLAVQCAVEMQNKLHAWKAGDDGEMSLHVGVGCGKVSALHVGGWKGQWEFFIMGTPLAQISIAEGQAKTGEVVVSKEAWNLIKGHCAGSQVGTEGCCKIEKILNPLPIRTAPIPTITDDMVPALRSYLQPVVNDRLSSGQALWLAELRRVTVMFLHLPIVELDETDPSSFELLQNATLEMQKAIHHWAGTIRQFMMDDKGSVLVVAFGLPPYSYENDAARCVMAALELQETLKVKLGLASTVGITTGSVFCGAVGSKDRREYAVVGDIVNLSARLMVAAKTTLAKNGIASETNNTLCDRATYDSCRNAEVKQMILRFKAVPPIKVKGKSEPISVYYPLGAKETAKSAMSTTTRMVGRTREWSVLQENLEHMISEREGSVVLIEGDAGLGKSMLLGELRRAAQQSDIKTIYGSADRIERATSLFPWRNALSDYIGFDSYDQSGDTNRQVLIDYARVIDETNPPKPQATSLASENLEKLLPLLNVIFPKLQLCDNEVTEEYVGDVRVDAAMEVLIRIMQASSQTSTLVILDNCQWFDSASWAMCKEIAHKVPNTMLVVSLRPMPAPEPPRYLELIAASGVNMMKLGPLSQEESIDLVCSTFVISELTPSIADVLVSRGHGNPFFIEEIVYHLFTTQAIKITRGICSIAEGIDIHTMPFPDSLQSVTRSRVDNLPTGPQFTLKVASVVGSQFTLKIIKNIHPISNEKVDVEADLNVLEQMDVIYQNTSLGGDGDNRVYNFRHTITEDVAYNLLLLEQRKQLHLSVGVYYEKELAENRSTSYERLAHHFTKAQAYEKAVRYLGLASREALESNENKEALYFLNKIDAICSEHRVPLPTSERSKTLLSQGEAHYRMGNMSKARTFLENALTMMSLPLPQGKTSPSSLSNIVDSQFFLALITGSRKSNANANPNRRIRRSQSIIDSPVAYLIYEKLAHIYLLTNDRSRLVDAVVFSANYAKSGGEEEEKFLLMSLVTISSRVFGLHSAADSYERFSTEATPMCTQLSASKIQYTLANSRLCTGSSAIGWQQCLSYIESGMNTFESTGLRRNWRELAAAKCFYFYHRGNFQECVDLGKMLADQGRQHLDNQSVWWGIASQVRGLLLLNEPEKAIKLLMEGKLIVDRCDYQDSFVRTDLFAMLSLTRLKRGRNFAQVAVESIEAALEESNPERISIHHHLHISYAMMVEVLISLLRDMQSKQGEEILSSESVSPCLQSQPLTPTEEAPRSPIMSKPEANPLSTTETLSTGVALPFATAHIVTRPASKSANWSAMRFPQALQRSFSGSSSPSGSSPSSPGSPSLTVKEKGRKGSDFFNNDWASSKPLKVEKKRLEKLLKSALELLSRHAQTFPIAKPVDYIWHGHYELYSGSPKQALKLWAKGLERAEKLLLPWEQVQCCYQIGQHATEEEERVLHMQKAVDICGEYGWKIEANQPI